MNKQYILEYQKAYIYILKSILYTYFHNFQICKIDFNETEMLE